MLQLTATWIKKTLNFNFAAKTSRGSMQQHLVYYVKLNIKDQPEIYGTGECAPLPGLSIDYRPDLEQELEKVCLRISEHPISPEISTPEFLKQFVNPGFPSIRFALETALLDLKNGGRKLIFENAFSTQEKGIPINGLIWMGDRDFMETQIRKKLAEGYSCLKLKIGGIDFKAELELLKLIRETADAQTLTIRLDANGAFKPEDALQKLEQLAAFEIHSIEQPIKQGQRKEMADLCRQSPIPVALDEELIGIENRLEKITLLEQINPPYIILKPTLVGGLAASLEWIQLATERNIDWWLTSALESNIGLNAISQFAGEFNLKIPQGLGTGQLYHNNIPSPLTIKNGALFYNQQKQWNDAVMYQEN